MKRYYFNLHECGRVVGDSEGCEFPGIDEAREHAVMEARAIMSAEVEEGRLCLGCHIEVVDEDGQVALTVPFTSALALTGG